jgi:hypothetical protein
VLLMQLPIFGQLLAFPGAGRASRPRSQYDLCAPTTNPPKCDLPTKNDACGEQAVPAPLDSSECSATSSVR